MIDTFPHRLDLDRLRRAFAASDPHGEAALNALLYAGSALMASAVLLVTTSPALVAGALALVPWIVLVVAGWLWISPAVRAQAAYAEGRSREVRQARELAADVLLDDSATPEQRRAAARIMLEGSDAGR